MDAKLLAFLKKHCPHHPELHDGKILDWQHGHKFIEYKDGEIVGFMTLLPQTYNRVRIGWGATIVLDMSLGGLTRFYISRKMMDKAKELELVYSAVGIVPAIEGPYKKYGLTIHRDWCNMYMRCFRPRNVLKYQGKSQWWNIPIRIVNFFTHGWKFLYVNNCERIEEFGPEWDIVWAKHGRPHRTAEYLNYKLSKPRTSYCPYPYRVYIHRDAGVPDGYIVFRCADHPTKDLNLVKVCDLVGSWTAKTQLLNIALQFAKVIKADAIVAIDDVDNKDLYSSMWIRKPYPIATSAKDKIVVTFFDADLDNLW